MNKCTCGSRTADHSIFCSGYFYIDPLNHGTYKPKSSSEKTCGNCFMVLNSSLFNKDSGVCNDCS
jgi:hypothetical protein